VVLSNSTWPRLREVGKLPGGQLLEMVSGAHSGVAGSGWHRIRAETAAARAESAIRKTGARRAKAWDRVVTTSDVLNAFSEYQLYRASLKYIAERVELVTHAWSRQDLSDAPGTLMTLLELAKSLEVPPGCRLAQESLLFAMRSYHTAMEGFDRAKVTGGRTEYEAAWGYVRDGDVLLALAIELADEA
jgi:hypothetical protein